MLTVSAWLTAQTDGLVPTARRLMLDEAMAGLCQEHSRWACWWFAGVTSDLMRALPSDDPWRHLSAGVGVGKARMTRGRWATPETGARGARDRFGSPSDGADLVLDVGLPPAADPGLAALADGLSDESAAVLAFAADGWKPGGLAAIAVVGSARETTFPVLGRCLAWAMWRHRCYAGAGDPLPMDSGQAWGWRADELAAGRDLDDAECARIEETIAMATPDGSWAETQGEA